MKTRAPTALALVLIAACSASSPSGQQGGAGGTAGTAALSCQAPACAGCEGCFDACLCLTGDTSACLTACGATTTGVCAAPECAACGSCMDLCLCTVGDPNVCAPACGQGGAGGTGGDPGVGGVGGTGADPGVGGSGAVAGSGGSSAGGCQDDGSGWNVQWQQWECEVLELTNQRRAQGASCGGQPYGPAGPLSMQPQLRYSARMHAKDMADKGYFDHTNLAGESPFDRMQKAGYQGYTMGENIAAGQTSPQSVVSGWMNSPGHCRNIMEGAYTDLGVGYYYSPSSPYGNYWVQNFGGS